MIAQMLLLLALSPPVEPAPRRSADDFRRSDPAERYLVPVANSSGVAELSEVAEIRDPLSLADVLASVANHDPRLAAAERTVDAAEGRLMAARGGFDTRVRVRGVVSPLGYYENGVLDVRAEQPTPLYGLTAWAGWRLGAGEFPVYEGKLETAAGGELSAGFTLPLWRDGAIDRRRADLKQAKLERERIAHGRDARALALEAEAAAAYWSWVAGGLRLEIERELLEMAFARDIGLRRQIELGAIEEIVGTDNRRVILAREARVVTAERNFQKAALQLSLFLRDDDGEPLLAGAERLPSDLPDLPAPVLGNIEAELAEALARRPDRAAQLHGREQARVEFQFARNQRGPRIDLSGWVAQDLGVAPDYLRPVELSAAIEVEIPIPLRQARGRMRAAEAELGRMDEELRLLEDRITTEVLDAHSAVAAAYQRAKLAQEQVQLVATLAEAEYLRFTLGDGDLLLVNLRELAVADATSEQVDAIAEFFIAKAKLDVALGENVQVIPR
jgi:cobalt-zinc-cadmium efflux system outer membrane protein